MLSDEIPIRVATGPLRRPPYRKARTQLDSTCSNSSESRHAQHVWQCAGRKVPPRQILVALPFGIAQTHQCVRVSPPAFQPACLPACLMCCASVHVCAHTHTNKHSNSVNTATHTRTHTHVHVYHHTHAHTHTHKHVHARARAHTHTHTHTHTRTHTPYTRRDLCLTTIDHEQSFGLIHVYIYYIYI